MMRENGWYGKKESRAKSRAIQWTICRITKTLKRIEYFEITVTTSTKKGKVWFWTTIGNTSGKISELFSKNRSLTRIAFYGKTKTHLENSQTSPFLLNQKVSEGKKKSAEKIVQIADGEDESVIAAMMQKWIRSLVS